MKTQSNDFAPAFEKARDAALTPDLTPAVMCDLVDAREFVKPSRAHLKRLARHAAGTRFVQPLRENREISPETMLLRAQLDFHKKMISELGGSRAIAPSQEIRYDAGRKAFIEYVPCVHQGEHELQPNAPQKELNRLAFKAKLAARKPFYPTDAELKAIEPFKAYEAVMADALAD